MTALHEFAGMTTDTSREDQLYAAILQRLACWAEILTNPLSTTYVVFNNSYRDDAHVNAMRFQELLRSARQN